MPRYGQAVACAGTSLTLDQKRNDFEVKTPRVALDSVERLLAGSGIHSLIGTLYATTDMKNFSSDLRGPRREDTV